MIWPTLAPWLLQHPWPNANSQTDPKHKKNMSWTATLMHRARKWFSSTSLQVSSIYVCHVVSWSHAYCSVGQKIHLLSKWTQSKSIFHNCTQRYWKYICGWLPSNNLKKFRWETFAEPPSSTFNSNLPWETPWWHPAFRSSCGVAAIVMLGDGSRCWRPGVPWLFGKPWGKHHIETLQMGLSENKVYPKSGWLLGLSCWSCHLGVTQHFQRHPKCIYIYSVSNSAHRSTFPAGGSAKHRFSILDHFGWFSQWNTTCDLVSCSVINSYL